MPSTIRSRANSSFKHWLRLRENRHRRRSGQFIVDGRREVARAIRSGWPLERLILADSAVAVLTEDAPADPPDTEAGMIAYLMRDVPEENQVQLERALFRQLAYGNRDEGCIGVFRTPDNHPRTTQSPGVGSEAVETAGTDAAGTDDEVSAPLWVIAENIEKPGNLGAIFRTADAVGADRVFLNGCCDALSPTAIRASLGCVFSVLWQEIEYQQLTETLQSNDVQVLAAIVDAPDLLWQCDLRRPTAIVVGAEDQGLHPRWQESAKPFRLPMQGIADSLNVSVTAAVCLYEAARQRAADR
ncbi:MAG: RNA methyltransferase [Planctomycetota bacterium]